MRTEDMPRKIIKGTTTEVSLVDHPANSHSTIEIAKRDEQPTPFRTREAALQAIADAECRQMFAKADITAGRTMSEYDRNRAAIFKGAVAPAHVPPGSTATADAAEYTDMMKRAVVLAKQIDVTPEQAFEAIYTSPGEIAKRRAKGAPPPPANSSETDDDDVDADPGDGEMDDADSGQELGPPRGPRGGSGIRSGGSSRGQYEMTGHPTMTNSRQATVGAHEGSYHPSKRPPSATRKSKVMKRVRKYLLANPRATAQEALHHATQPKHLRKAMKTG
jgi:hypothetical protein